MKALLSAQAELGVKPRILGVPGHDTLEVATALAGICQSCVHLVMSALTAAKRYRMR